MMTLILAMSTLIPSLQTTCPRRMLIGVAKMHFLCLMKVAFAYIFLALIRAPLCGLSS